MVVLILLSRPTYYYYLIISNGFLKNTAEVSAKNADIKWLLAPSILYSFNFFLLNSYTKKKVNAKGKALTNYDVNPLYWKNDFFL